METWASQSLHAVVTTQPLNVVKCSMASSLKFLLRLSIHGALKKAGNPAKFKLKTRHHRVLQVD